ncbi:hypothetical protein Nmel_012900 [Mimus melanotis]
MKEARLLLQCTQSCPGPGRIPTCWTQHECPTSGKSDCCDSELSRDF